MKRHLFYAFLGLYLATALVTFMGILGVAKIEDFYLKSLFGTLVIESGGAMFAVARKLDFFAREKPQSRSGPRLAHHLFYSVLLVVLIAAIIALLGVLNVDFVKIEEFYLKGLFLGVLLEVVGLMILVFTKIDFENIGEEDPGNDASAGEVSDEASPLEFVQKVLSACATGLIAAFLGFFVQAIWAVALIVGGFAGLIGSFAEVGRLAMACVASLVILGYGIGLPAQNAAAVFKSRTLRTAASCLSAVLAAVPWFYLVWYAGLKTQLPTLALQPWQSAILVGTLIGIMAPEFMD